MRGRAITRWNTRTPASEDDVTDEMLEEATRQFYYEASSINKANGGLSAPNYSSLDQQERDQLKQCVRAAITALTGEER